MLRKLFYLLILSSSTTIFATSCPPDLDLPNYLKVNDDSQLAKAPADENYRLGNETAPSYYKIEIGKIEKVGRFHATVQIQFKALVPDVRAIWLQGEGILVDDETVNIYKETAPTKNIYDKLNNTLVVPYQKYRFDLKDALSVGDPYVIEIQYIGVLYSNKDMRGLYQSYYKQDNMTKTLYTTHFGQQARRLMPCWDENRFKAQFEFHVQRDATMHSLSISNAKIKNTTPDNIDHYEPTSIISPYLLALVLSDFAVNKAEKFAIYARPQAINQSRFALELGPQLIAALDEWTNMPYYEVPGVQKMEIAAIPDFTAGAMENWGLLIHREVNILYESTVAHQAQRQKIALILAHEIAHMWFGGKICD